MTLTCKIDIRARRPASHPVPTISFAVRGTLDSMSED